MNAITRILGFICDKCPFCSYARSHPDTFYGRIMEWHGKFCPFWKAQKKYAEWKKEQKVE